MNSSWKWEKCTLNWSNLFCTDDINEPATLRTVIHSTLVAGISLRESWWNVALIIFTHSFVVFDRTNWMSVQFCWHFSLAELSAGCLSGEFSFNNLLWAFIMALAHTDIVHEGWLVKSPPTKRIWRAVSVFLDLFWFISSDWRDLEFVNFSIHPFLKILL